MASHWGWCPDHTKAFASHAVLSRYLAEGIYRLLEPWPIGDDISVKNRDLLKYPTEFLGRQEDQVKEGMEWKMSLQGQVPFPSTFAFSGGEGELVD